MTRRQLADALGVSSTAVYLWEQGTRSPPIPRLKEIARELEVAEADFFVPGVDDA